MASSSLQKYFIAVSILAWVLMMVANAYLVIASEHQVDFVIPDNAIIFTECVFFLGTFLSFQRAPITKGNANFNDQLWQVFIIGATTMLLSLMIKFLINFLEESGDAFVFNFLYQINTILVVIFLANAFYVWKKMILFQKSIRTEIAWTVFEVLALVSIISNFFLFDLTDIYLYIYSLPLIVLGLVLSFNLKWVAFLNYKQKWNSILLVVLIALISLTFIQQILEYQSSYILISEVFDMGSNMFLIAMFAFIVLNCFTSFLVLVFHLPTSSVFEQKFGEVMIFQRLSQSIQDGQKEEEVYEILFDSSMTTVMADAGWLEVIDEKGNYKAFINKNISEFDIFEIKKLLRKNHINITNEPQYIKNIKQLNYTEKISELNFRSFLLIPLYSHNQQLGSLALLKNINDGFDKEMVDTVFSFVSQASMAIKNFRLIYEAIEHERYKEEIKIAHDVQKSLLPESLFINIHVEMSAYSKGAAEVGGDYYDLFQHDPNNFSVVIGDVSGHGTSAAFNMAQMKGVFQSLAQLNLESDQFMIHANQALSKCLEKKSFITLSYFIIDTATQQIQFARAGHCPTLYYSAADNQTSYIQSKGLGLGIIRKGDYSAHIEKQVLKYNKGDMMVLFTDGIIEATNSTGDEYGYDRLQEVINHHRTLGAKQLIEKITENLYAFTGTRDLHDDYTLLIIKFA